MWTTVLLLGLAVNLEPTRIGLVPLLLARDRPIMQLLAYLVGSLTVNLGFGLVILFVFHRNPFGDSSSNGGKAQIAVGALALVVAALLAVLAGLTLAGGPVSGYLNDTAEQIFEAGAYGGAILGPG